MKIAELRRLERTFDLQALECILKAVEVSNAPDYPSSLIDYLLHTRFTMDWLIKKMQSSYFIVALIDNKVVGTGSLDGNKIKHVFIDPDHQRKGIGQTIMKELERYSKNQGLKEIFLNSSITAFEFYKTLNYQLVEESVREHQGDKGITYLMKKRFSARACP